MKRREFKSYVGEDLRNKVFKDLDLTGANFLKANLSGAKFKNCILDDASFTFANLEGTVFQNCSRENCGYFGAFGSPL